MCACACIIPLNYVDEYRMCFHSTSHEEDSHKPWPGSLPFPAGSSRWCAYDMHPLWCDHKITITGDTQIRWTENRHYCQAQKQAQSATYRHRQHRHTDTNRHTAADTDTNTYAQTLKLNTHLENSQLKYMCCWDTRGKVRHQYIHKVNYHTT